MKRGRDQVEILVGGTAFATYVFNDPRIKRPYFTGVHAVTGQQVTRHHPPRPGVDSTDHATMHPGIHLAFGDISGADFWRNRGVVRHAGFTKKPTGGERAGEFTVRNLYQAGKRLVCEEVCRHRVLVRPAGVLLTYESRFLSHQAGFVFGDQEEMGLGVRVDRALRVRGGRGTILNSVGGKNEKQTWGRQAAWCDYSGLKDGRRVGLAVMTDPGNFRASWFHSRDYGLLVANPFGRKAFRKGAASRVEVARGEPFTLRFGILIHSSSPNRPVDLKAAYSDFVAALKR